MKLERVEAIYGELEGLVVELSPDPVARGPGYLQEVISKTRGYLNKTSIYHQEIMREQYILERELVALESAYEVSSDALLADDHRVTRLPNIDDRKAMINLILKEDKVRILDLKRGIRELSFVEKVVRHRQKELDNTMAALRMQKSLMDSETRAGSFYGDETDASRNRRVPMRTQDDVDEDELARLLGDDLAVSPAPQEAPESAVESAAEDAPQPVGEEGSEEPQTAAVESVEDEDISRFLDGDDLSEILNSV